MRFMSKGYVKDLSIPNGGRIVHSHKYAITSTSYVKKNLKII